MCNFVKEKAMIFGSVKICTNKEAASKLWDKGVGVNILSNKKCLMGRTFMNQNALYSSDLGKYFTYSERMRTTHRKFFYRLLKSKSSPKTRTRWQVRQSFRDLNFKKSTPKSRFLQ